MLTASWYRQVEINKKDREKLAFISHHELYRFIRMPFGLQIAPGTFQRTTDVIQYSVKLQLAKVYLDEVVNFSESLEQHIDHVGNVLFILQNAGVTLKT